MKKVSESKKGCSRKSRSAQSRCLRSDSAKSTTVQLDSRSALLVRLLGLTPDQAKALQIICEWEGKTIRDYIRWSLLPVIRMSFDDMRGIVKPMVFYTPSAKERRWALRFYKRVAPLIEGREAEYAG